MSEQLTLPGSSDTTVRDEAPGISEVSRLATLLADRVLDAQITSQPVPDGHIRSLLEAALLLREYGQELPSLLSQIMHEVDKPAADVPVEVQAKAEEAEDDVSRLAWLFRPFQGTKG
jgi:hypothetical protein